MYSRMFKQKRKKAIQPFDSSATFWIFCVSSYYLLDRQKIIIIDHMPILHVHAPSFFFTCLSSSVFAQFYHFEFSFILLIFSLPSAILLHTRVIFIFILKNVCMAFNTTIFFLISVDICYMNDTVTKRSIQRCYKYLNNS